MIDGWFAVVQELVTVAAETLKVLLRTLDGWMDVLWMWEEPAHPENACGASTHCVHCFRLPCTSPFWGHGGQPFLGRNVFAEPRTQRRFILQSFLLLGVWFYFWSCSECSLWVVSILLECNLLFCWVPSAEGKVGNWEIREYNVLYQEAEQPPSLESHTAWEDLLLKAWYVKSQCWLLG